MRSSIPSVGLEVDAVAPSVPGIRASLRAFAARHGAGLAMKQAVGLAVTEAAGTAVVHAYAPGTAGTIRVDADVADGELEIVVSDDGRGLPPSAQRGKRVGRGLALIRAQTTAFVIRDRPVAGVEVWMRFSLASDRHTG